MSNFVILDSDSDSNHESPPKRRIITSKRGGRKRGASSSSRRRSNRKASQRAAASIFDCINISVSDEEFESGHKVTVEVPQTTDNSQQGLGESTEPQNDDKDDKLSGIQSAPELVIKDDFVSNPLPVSRKQGRRGLAKKKSHLSSEHQPDAPVHNACVYSQRVPHRRPDKDNLLGSAISNGNDRARKDEIVEDEQIKSEKKRLEEESDCHSSTTAEQRVPVHYIDSDVEEKEDESVSSNNNIRSPTPPPETSTTQRIQAKRMKKNLSSALRTLTNVKDTLASQATTPKRRTRKCRDSDVVLMNVESPPTKAVTVKVRYLSSVYRMVIEKTDPFHILISKLSKEIGEAEHTLSLFLHDKPLALTACPNSVQLTVADIIECHCIKSSNQQAADGDVITLFIQCRNNRSRVLVKARRRMPLRDVLEKYAAEKNLQASHLKFSFDGEEVELDDSPAKLDMDDKDVIDLISLVNM